MADRRGIQALVTHVSRLHRLRVPACRPRGLFASRRLGGDARHLMEMSGVACATRGARTEWMQARPRRGVGDLCVALKPAPSWRRRMRRTLRSELNLVRTRAALGAGRWMGGAPGRDSSRSSRCDSGIEMDACWGAHESQRQTRRSTFFQPPPRRRPAEGNPPVILRAGDRVVRRSLDFYEAVGRRLAQGGAQ